MKITIFGSTGGTGLALLQQAIQRGHQVVTFAQEPQKVSISDPRLKVIQVDVLDGKLSNRLSLARRRSSRLWSSGWGRRPARLSAATR